MSLALLLLLTNAVEVSEEPDRILLMNLTATAADLSGASMFNGSIAEALSKSKRAEVITVDDIRQIASLEAEQQAAACDVESCLTEVANALGARFVFYGTTTRVAKTWVVQLVLLDAYAGRALERRERRGDDVVALAAALKGTVVDMLGERKVEAPVEAEAAGPPMGALLGGGVATLGALLAVGGGVGMFIADTQVKTDPAAAFYGGWSSTAALGAGVLAATAGGVWMGVALAE